MARPLLALPLLALLSASRLAAQQPDTLAGMPRLRLREDTLRLVLPPELAPGGRLALPRPAAGRVAAAWADTVRARLARRDAALWRAVVQGLPTGYAPPVAAPTYGGGFAPPPPSADQGSAGVLRRYADLNLLMNARFELRFDQLRNLRCTPAEADQLGSGCTSALNPPTFDPQFNVRSGGVIGQRVNLNVDYDSKREFEASNNIQVYYQGLEDEILRRVDVGNVSFVVPPSRFITAGIPANNFGVQASAQLGALDFTGIFAQQKGNVVRGRTFTVGDQTVQPLDREIADRDFEPLRFFFVVDPATLPAYPRVDVLGLSGQALPAADQVTQVRVYRRRSLLNQANTAQQNLTGIPAVGLRPDSPQRAGPFSWELLIEGRDYYLDASGLWFGLAARLDQDDFLAVSYVTAAGDTVGTFPAAAVAGRVDTLRLIYEPRRAADVPTFRYEIRSFYRVGAQSDVVRESARLRILVGESERPASGAATFLAQLGVAQEIDPTTFDQFNRLFPRGRDPGLGAPIKDDFIVFPTLQPFADSTVLPPAFRNDSLYRTPTYLLRTQGPTPLFTLQLHYDARGGDNRGVISLGGFQIREGSEKVTADGRLLTRNVDYTINYEIGQVTFIAPDSLFQGPTTVGVQYEEQPAFAIAPTSIYGLQSRYDFGEHGTVTALGLLQSQRTTFTRPPLGFEPSSHFVGGITGNFRFAPDGLTRLIGHLPFVRTETPSQITLDAELATSRPSPNQVGVAYVETFEEEGGTFLGLGENLWQVGSRPSSGRGLEAHGIDPALGFQDQDAAALTWQSLIGSSTGVVQFQSNQIDPSIVVQGAGATAEPVLWFLMHPDTVGGLPDRPTGRVRWYVPHTPGPRWRSITQALSATGTDLSRIEYLELWVYEDAQRTARTAGATLVFDFGTVYEDAVDFVPRQFTVGAQGDTVYTGRRRAHEGHLQTERDTLTGAWNAAINDTGVFGDVADSIYNATTGTEEHNVPLCESELGRGLVVYRWGDMRARCTRHNGQADGDDLDGDGHLDTLVSATPESFFRYVFPIGDDRYYVRDGGLVAGSDTTTVGRWRLYRIPFHTDTLQVGAPNIRLVKQLRMTLVVPSSVGPEGPVYFALSRVKLVGAPWVKRASAPIRGLDGALGAAHGEVVASVVSTENRADLGYEPPPGVTDAGETKTGGLSAGQVQINERSLRLIGYDVRSGERAEAFYRFPEGQRNFLGYRQMRVWARGRGAAWDRGELEFYVKVAQDENNFYLLRAPARTTTWLPEVVVDFNRWLDLRAQIEARFLSGRPPDAARAQACGGDTLAYVACDGPYLVQVLNPGVAPPNLSAVRELAVGFLRDSGQTLDSAELWVDDIRLTQVVNTPGYAGAVNLHVAAADVADLNLAMTRRDAQFRQLGEDPPYVGTSQLSLASTVRLEKFGLERLGLSAPLTFRLDRSADDPYFLSGTDVLAGPLQGLRRPRASQSSFAVALRRSRRGTRWWERALVDNLTLSVAGNRGRTVTQLSDGTASALNLRADYQVNPGERGFRYVPGFLVRLIRSLPAFIGRSDFANGLDGARLRWTPVSIRLSTSYSRVAATQTTYRVPIATESDTLATTVATTQAALQQDVGLDLQPFRSLLAGLQWSQQRDLHNYGDSTTVGVLAGQDSRRLLGVGVGFERRRTLASRLTWQPPWASWLRPRVSFNSTFTLNRDPTSGAVERLLGDTLGGFRIPVAFENQRTTDLSFSIDPSRLARGLLGDSSLVRKAFDVLNPVDLSTRSDRRSQFSQGGLTPDLGYQLALGGLGAFRSLDGVPADAAYDASQVRVAGGARLPAGMSLTSEYQRQRSTTWARRGEGQSELRQEALQWPSFTARWNWSPRQALVRRVITSLGASATYRRQVTETVQPPFLSEADTAGLAQTGIVSSQTTTSWPVTLTVNWAPRITTTLSLAPSSAAAAFSGNETRFDRSDASADVSFVFRAPQQYLPLPSVIRTALRYANSVSTGCVVRVGDSTCVPISDSRRRQMNLTMDTDLPPNVSAGLGVSYIVTEDRHANRKTAQFVVTASVTINFQAGEIR